MSITKRTCFLSVSVGSGREVITSWDLTNPSPAAFHYILLEMPPQTEWNQQVTHTRPCIMRTTHFVVHTPPREWQQWTVLWGHFKPLSVAPLRSSGAEIRHIDSSNTPTAMNGNDSPWYRLSMSSGCVFTTLQENVVYRIMSVYSQD